MSATPPNSYPPPRQALGHSAPKGEVDAKLGLVARVLLAVVALAMIATLALAFSLKPDPSGMGTHQQIPGFGPCTVQFLLGFPCPACGMTTSWSLFTKGQIFAALMTSASGTILAAVCALASVWFLMTAFRGKWPGLAPTPMQVAIPALAWLAMVIAEWLLRRWPDIFG